MPSTLPVLISGAGPTGLTAALELSRLGIPVRIVDKLSEFSTTSRALAVQARTLELFQERGLTNEMLQIGNIGRGTVIYGNGKQLGELDLTLIPSRFNFILLIPQSETERLLREHVGKQGVTIETQTEVVAFSQTDSLRARDGHVLAILRKADGSLEQVKAAYVIAAEGAHSSIRHTLGLEFKGKSLQHRYALADLHLDGDLPDDQLSIFLADKGLLAAFPMGNRRFRMIATEPEPSAETADPTVEEVQRLYDAGSHIPARLHDMVWSSRFRINSRMLDHLRVGRIFFGGDAAHVHSPAGGQGMNTGIQDMVNLCWKIALVHQGHAKPDLLDTYEAERHPVIQGIVSKTEGATDIFDSDNSLVHTLLTHVAPIALSSAKVKRKSAGTLSQVETNYRKSPLVSSAHAPGSVEPGDRIPDLAVLLPTDGEPVPATLLDLLDPNRFTLLTLDGSDLPSSDSLPEHWIKTISVAPAAPDSKSDPFREAFGSARQILVRPDGHVAAINDARHASECASWFSRWRNDEGDTVEHEHQAQATYS